jgi:hypothetical protein
MVSAGSIAIAYYLIQSSAIVALGQNFLPASGDDDDGSWLFANSMFSPFREGGSISMMGAVNSPQNPCDTEYVNKNAQNEPADYYEKIAATRPITNKNVTECIANKSILDAKELNGRSKGCVCASRESSRGVGYCDKTTSLGPDGRHNVKWVWEACPVTCGNCPAVPAIPPLEIEVPCLPFGAVQPCGNVTIPDEGLTFNFWFGKSYHVPGGEFFEEELKNLDKSFGGYMVWGIYIALGLKALQCCVMKKKRNKVKKALKDIAKGKIDDEDSDDEAAGAGLSKEEKEDIAKQRMNIDSEHFVAPPNVFRICAVLHPGKVGYPKYFQYCLQAGVTVYMQMFMPVKIIMDTLSAWKFGGVKSPIWFVSNAMTFLTTFAALASICKVFSTRCIKMMRDTVDGNDYLLAKNEPCKEGGMFDAVSGLGSGLMATAGNVAGAAKDTAGGATGLATGLLSGAQDAVTNAGDSAKGAVAGAEEGKVPKDDATKGTAAKGTAAAADLKDKGAAAVDDVKGKGAAAVDDAKAAGGKALDDAKGQAQEALAKMTYPPSWVIYTLKLAWCASGVVSDMFMCFVLLLAMFLKIATFTGAIQDVALVLVAFWFVFDLQLKILETDPISN